MRLQVCFLLLVLALLNLARPVSSAPEGAQDKPRPMLGDLARLGRPFAVAVPVSNSSSKTQPCRIVLSAGGGNRVSGEARLSLAPGSRHLVPLITPVGNYYQQINIESPGAPATPTPVNCTAVSDQDTLALVLSPVGTEFAYLAGYKALLPGGEFRINHPPRGGTLAPSWYAYLGVDLVIIYDLPRLNLAPEVQETLLDWTRLGGTLILVSNADGAEYRGSAFESVLPVQVRGSESSQFGSHLKVTPRPGARSLFRKGDLDLAWVGELNEGQVVVVTAPVVDQKVLGPDVTQDMWKEIIHCFQDGCPFARLRFRNLPRLTHPVELPKPSAAGIAWYLVLYVLVVIPMNYWVLRRKDKMLWLIVTLPVLSTIIAALSFAINAMQRGSETVLRELGVAVVGNHCKVAVADHSLMLFSPSSAGFKLEFPKSTYLRPQELDNNGFSQREVHLVSEADSSYYRDFHIPMWSLARFRSTSLRPLDGPISVVVESREKGRCDLQVENLSGLTLKNCHYYDGRAFSQKFDLGPGKNSIQADMKSTPTFAEVLGTSTELPLEDLDSLGTETQSLMASGLLGWSSEERLTGGVKLDHAAKHIPQTLVVVPVTRPRVARPPTPNHKGGAQATPQPAVIP